MKKFLKIMLIIIFLPISLPILVAKSKLPKVLKFIFLALYLGFFLIVLLTPSKYTPEERAATKTASALLRPTKIKTSVPTETLVQTETPVLTEMQEPTAADIPAEIPTQEPEKEVFSIDGDNPGHYGKQVTLNSDTDQANSFIGYFIPAGTYIVETTDTPWNQFNLYTEETVLQDSGYEEYADSKVWLIYPGKPQEIEMPGDGWFVKVSPKSNFTLTRIK